MKEKEFYSVREVAQILSLSPDRIYEYLRTDRIHGSRLTKKSAWRIPATEIERLKGTSRTKADAPPESKHGKWLDVLDLVAQLQNSLSHISPKDWAIWGLPDTGQPPMTSEAGLKLWIDRGNLIVRLTVEQDQRFSLLMTRLKKSYSEFKSYDEWKASLTDFVRMCQSLAQEIQGKAEEETGLTLSPYFEMGKGHLINVPRFIYEFALDNYPSGGQPVLAILQIDSKHYKLVPEDLPDYILAISYRKNVEQCKSTTISLASQYARDHRISQIKAKALEIMMQADKFHAALSTVVEEASADS